jgi:hypothetical protein
MSDTDPEILPVVLTPGERGPKGEDGQIGLTGLTGRPGLPGDRGSTGRDGITLDRLPLAILLVTVGLVLGLMTWHGKVIDDHLHNLDVQVVQLHHQVSVLQARP